MLFEAYNHCLAALRGCHRGHLVDEQGTFHSGDLRTRSIGLDTPQAPPGSADMWSRACVDPWANPTAQSVAEHDPRVVAQLNMAHCNRAYAMLTPRSVPATNGAKVDQQRSIRPMNYLSLNRSRRIVYSFLQTPSRALYHHLCATRELPLDLTWHGVTAFTECLHGVLRQRRTERR